MSQPKGFSRFTWPRFRYYPVGGIESQVPRDLVRIQLLQACERLNIDPDLWPKFQPSGFWLPSDFSRIIIQAPFELAGFDLLRDSPSEWRESVRAAFDKYCDDFMNECQDKLDADVKAGRLRVIPETRGASPIPLRFEWAARRYCFREGFKSMATAEYSPDSIKQTVYKIFKNADLPKRKGK